MVITLFSKDSRGGQPLEPELGPEFQTEFREEPRLLDTVCGYGKGTLEGSFLGQLTQLTFVPFDDEPS